MELIGTTNVQSFSKSATSSSPATLNAFTWTFTKSGYYIWQNYNSILVTVIPNNLTFNDTNGYIYSYIDSSNFWEVATQVTATMLEYSIGPFYRSNDRDAPSSSSSAYSVMNNFVYDRLYDALSAEYFVTYSAIYRFGSHSTTKSSSCSGSWQLKLYGSKLN